MPLDVPVGAGGYPISALRVDGANQTVAANASGGASTQSSAFGANTRVIRICFVSGTAGAALRYKTGSNPTASALTNLLPANAVEYVTVKPGWKIAVLSNDAGTPSVNITEIPDIETA